jgi:hypothetical protein
MYGCVRYFSGKGLLWYELSQLCFSGFSLLWQAPEANNLKEERFVWLTVSEVSLRDYLVPLLLDLWQDRGIMVEECGRRKQLSSWLLESRERNMKLPRMVQPFKDPLVGMHLPQSTSLLTFNTSSKCHQILNSSMD